MPCRNPSPAAVRFRNLHHPGLVRLTRDFGDRHGPSLELHHEEDDVADEPSQSQDFDSEEVGCSEAVPMRGEERLPRRVRAALRCGFAFAMRTNSAARSALVLGPPGRRPFEPFVFLRNERPIPSQERVRCDDADDAPRRRRPRALPLRRQQVRPSSDAESLGQFVSNTPIVERSGLGRLSHRTALRNDTTIVPPSCSQRVPISFVDSWAVLHEQVRAELDLVMGRVYRRCSPNPITGE